MIGYLKGEVIFKDLNSLILDVSGVGYKILAASHLLRNVHRGSRLTLFIHTHVREDNLSLFGFLEAADLKLFENLIGVAGIGPKTAMNIFSIGDRSQIVQAIISADTAFFKGVPRLGQKNAQKIIIELKNKFGGDGEIDLNGQNFDGNEEAVVALKGFGFTAKEIYETIKHVKKNGQKTTDTIKLALKYLGK